MMFSDLKFKRILDVGANQGLWSRAAAKLFPEATFQLVKCWTTSTVTTTNWKSQLPKDNQMTPTKKTLTDTEYPQYSSDICPSCNKRFGVMARGWDISLAYKCPHCNAIVAAAPLRRVGRRDFLTSDSKLNRENHDA